MHTDRPSHAGADAIVAEAKLRGVPVVSAAQMLDWLDGRNGSSFQNVSYAGQRLRFTVAGGRGSRGLQGMLPAQHGGRARCRASRATACRSSRPLAGQGHELRVLRRRGRQLRRDLRRSGAGDDDHRRVGVRHHRAVRVRQRHAPARASSAGSTAPRSPPAPARSSTRACPRGPTRSRSGRSTRGHRRIRRPAERQFTVGTPRSGGSARAPGPARAAAGRGEDHAQARADHGGRHGPAPRPLPEGQRKCRVKLKLRATRKTVAARTFLVKGGKSRVIELTLHRSTRASLARKRHPQVTAVAVSKNPSGDRAVTRKTIRLVGR